MKKNTMRVIVILLAVALLIGLMLPLLTALASASGQVTQGDADKTKGEIADIKDGLADIAAEKKKVNAQLSAARKDKSRAKEALDLIVQQIVLTEDEITTTQRLLDQYDLAIQDREEEIIELEAQEAEQYEEFYAQVRWMEETGSVSYLSIFFEASSFAEMLDYAMLITDIMDYSDRIITALERTQQQLSLARSELQEARTEQDAVKDELEVQKADLEDQKAEAEKLYDQIAEQEADLAAAARKLAQDEAEMNDALKAAEKKYAQQIAALNNSGDWYWPLPGIYKLSSLFGARKDPFTGKASNHTGTDIPASSGTKIYSAQGGVVTTVGKNKNHSYGYYVIITHGNGVSTLYAHMKSVASVKEGETVKKGQVIGYVGSTGRSTGPHLHFEFRVNGVRADALKYYPGITFTSPGGGKIQGGK